MKSSSRATGTATTGECISVAEPMTMLTDYALGGVSGVLGLLIFKNSAVSARLWGVAFLALALTAILGGTFHGFRIAWTWKPTVLAIGVASFGMLAGSAYATTA